MAKLFHWLMAMLVTFVLPMMVCPVFATPVGAEDLYPNINSTLISAHNSTSTVPITAPGLPCPTNDSVGYSGWCNSTWTTAATLAPTLWPSGVSNSSVTQMSSNWTWTGGVRTSVSASHYWNTTTSVYTLPTSILSASWNSSTTALTTAISSVDSTQTASSAFNLTISSRPSTSTSLSTSVILSTSSSLYSSSASSSLPGSNSSATSSSLSTASSVSTSTRLWSGNSTSSSPLTSSSFSSSSSLSTSSAAFTSSSLQTTSTFSSGTSSSPTNSTAPSTPSSISSSSTPSASSTLSTSSSLSSTSTASSSTSSISSNTSSASSITSTASSSSSPTSSISSPASSSSNTASSSSPASSSSSPASSSSSIASSSSSTASSSSSTSSRSSKASSSSSTASSSTPSSSASTVTSLTSTTISQSSSTTAAMTSTTSTITTSTSPSPTPFKGFLLANVSVSIDNQTYHPPAAGQAPIVLVLSNGTTVQLTSTSIVGCSESLDIPDSGTLSQNGGSLRGLLCSWNVDFAPRTFPTAGNTGCTGDAKKCFLQALAALFSSSSFFSDALASIGSAMLSSVFSDAAAAAGVAADGLAFSLTDLAADIASSSEAVGAAIDAMDGAMSAVNGAIGSMESIELTDFGTINGNIVEAYSYSSLQTTSTILRNMNNVLQTVLKAGSTTPGVTPLLAAAKSQWGLLVAGGGTLAMGAWGAAQFGSSTASDIEAAMPGKLNKTVTINETDGAGNSSYWLHFSQGFSIPLFNIITLELDNDAGIKTGADPSLNADFVARGYAAPIGPGYTTRIRPEQALLLSVMPSSVLRTVYQHPTWEQWEQMRAARDGLRNMTEGSGKDSSKKPPQPKATSDKFTPIDDDLTKRFYVESVQSDHLNALSWQKGKPKSDQRYKRDNSWGAGTTVFILDSGFNVQDPIWSFELRYPKQYVVPTSLTLANIDPWKQTPQTILDFDDHGTGMACLAGGNNYGAAAGADMYLIKGSGTAINLNAPSGWHSIWTPDGLHDAFVHIAEHVKNNKLQGKAVVSFSQGFDYPRYIRDPTLWAQYKYDNPGTNDDSFTTLWPTLVTAYNNVFDDWFDSARDNGIIWVQAVGNDGYVENSQSPIVALGDGIPSNRGTRDNELIQVGCGMSDGTLCPWSSPRGIHVGGQLIQDDNDPRLPPGSSLSWVDIYAPGNETLTCSHWDGVTKIESGTSASTAIVAGLAAYLLALPEHAQRFRWSDDKNKAKPWGSRMKELMVSLSYQWTDGPSGIIDPQLNGVLPFNTPSMVNMAYNGAYGPMNSCPVPPIVRRDGEDVVNYDLCIPAANETEVTTWDTTASPTLFSWVTSLTSSVPSFPTPSSVPGPSGFTTGSADTILPSSSTSSTFVTQTTVSSASGSSTSHSMSTVSWTLTETLTVTEPTTTTSDNAQVTTVTSGDEVIIYTTRNATTTVESGATSVTVWVTPSASTTNAVTA